MRPSGLLLALIAFAVLAVVPVPRATGQTSVDAPRTPPPRPDSTAVPGARADSIPVPFATVDSAAAAPGDPAARPVAPVLSDSATADSSGFAISADEARKRGASSFPELLRGRRPILLGRAPAFGPLGGPVTLPDAGSIVRPWPDEMTADRATDRTVVAALGSGLGIPDLAIAWGGAEVEGIEAFEYVALDERLAPGPLRAAGELLTRPRARRFTSDAVPGEARPPERVRSVLYYEKGEGRALDTGARFASPLLGWGVAGSFTRRDADGLDPLLRSLSTRYEVAVGLPKLGSMTSWIEGTLFQREAEIASSGGYFTGAIHARAEWASRQAALHARLASASVETRAALRVGRATATQVGYAGERERWAYPELAAEAWATGRRGGGWSWSLGAEAKRRRVEYRVDSASAFRPGVATARATAGLRRALGSGGVAADVAVDAREGDRPFLDARLSLWQAGERARLRVDLESAHERPSLVDLLTPSRSDTSFVLDPIPRLLVLSREGNPALEARALRGLVAAASFAPRRGVELLAFGSARRVTRDFGWDARLIAGLDTLRLDESARERGDGWAAHAALGGSASVGPLVARALGWIRGGRGALSPRAGSPPRAGVDGLIGARATLFGGDLPLEAGVEAHAIGARRGLIRAPALVSWDGYLRADFGSAGLFGRVTNLFDRILPSSFYEVDLDRGAPLPGRSLRVGVVWYLFD